MVVLKSINRGDGERKHIAWSQILSDMLRIDSKHSRDETISERFLCNPCWANNWGLVFVVSAVSGITHKSECPVNWVEVGPTKSKEVRRRGY